MLLGYSPLYATKLNLMKCHEKLCDGGSRLGATHLAHLLALEEHETLVFFLQRISSISCHRGVFKVVLLGHFTVWGSVGSGRP